MPRLPDTVKWRDFSGGNVQAVSSDITNPSSVPFSINLPSSVPFSINLLFSEILGEAVSRPGTGLVGAPGSGDCIGLFQHLDTTGANSVLMAGFGTSIYNAVSSASLTASLTSGAKQRFATFLNATLMLNGVEARAYTSAAGFVSSGGVLNVDGVPAGGQFPIEFKDRLYCAVADRIYYTNTPTSGSVSWSATGSGSIQVEQEDGGGTIKSLSKVPGYLMILKERSLKRWNFSSTFPEDLVNIGTQSHESVLRARGRIFFFYGPNGFYESAGDYPKLISRPIQRIVDGIASSSYSDVNGWSDNDNLYWSVGTVTVDFDRGYSETYTNAVVRYSIDTQQWAVLRYAHLFKQMHQYVSSGLALIVGGDDTGQVLQLNTGTSDYSGNAISYILQSPEFDFKARGRLKTVSEKIFVHSDLTSGAILQARLDYGEWKHIGFLRDIVTEAQIKPLTAHVFEFRIVDSITGAAVKLRGMDFPNVDVLISS